MLRTLPADHRFDEARVAELSRRIRAAGAERLQVRRRIDGTKRRLRSWTRGAISLGAAASIAIVAVLFTTTSATITDVASAATTTSTAKGVGLHVPDRGTLLAASYGAVSDEEFLGSLWGQFDTETLIERSQRND